MPKRKQKTLSETVRAAIGKRDENLLKISKDSGVPYASLHGWINGTTESIRSDSLDRLAAYCGVVATIEGE